MPDSMWQDRPAESGCRYFTVMSERAPNALTRPRRGFRPGWFEEVRTQHPRPIPMSDRAMSCSPAAPPVGEITQILQAVGRGEAQASEELLPLVYHDLRRQAAVQMAREAAGQTLQPTALLHEAWLRVVGGGERKWQNRAHFFGAAAEAMRRILIENARRKARLKRGGRQVRVDLDHIELAATTPDEKVLLINDALERLKIHDQLRAQVVMLKFFGGRTNHEVAECLAVTERMIERHWAYAKAWLFQNIRERG